MQPNTQDSNFTPDPASPIYSDAGSGIILRPGNASHVGDSALQHIAFGTDKAKLYWKAANDQFIRKVA